MGAVAAFAGLPGGEIVERVRQHALRQPAPGTLESALAASAANDAAVNAALRRFDRYAAWYSPEALAARKSAVNAASAGVGMDLVQDRAGALVCIPYAGSPAARAGLHYGDELVAVDGRPVQDLSVEAVIQAVRGDAGTPVLMQVRRYGSQQTESLVLRRERVEAPLLERVDEGGTPCLRLYQFTPRVKTLLERELTRMAASPPARLIVDLRGNNGGDLDAAVACAELFLPRGAVSLHSRSAAGETVRRAGQNGLAAAWRSALILRQDGLTASAAEVFISALACLDRAESQGLTSAGKASIQTLFRLEGGGVLKLTTEQLLFPGQGFSWQDSGLRPDTFVSQDHQTRFVEKKQEVYQ